MINNQGYHFLFLPTIQWIIYIFIYPTIKIERKIKRKRILDSVIFAGLLIILGGVSIASQAGTK